MSPDINVVVSPAVLKWTWRQIKHRGTDVRQLPTKVKEKALLIDFWEKYGSGQSQPILVMSAKEGLREDGTPDKISHDIKASLRILESLESTYRRNDGNILNYERIELDGDDPNIDEVKQRTNIITVGGPEVNDITEEALDDCPNGYDFEDIDTDGSDPTDADERKIIDKGSNNYFKSTTPSEDGWEDLALVARIRNTLDGTDGSSDLIVVCGTYGPGTVAAADFFNRPDLLEEVYDGDTEYFQAVLRVHVNGLGTISGMKIEDKKVIREQTYDDQ